MQKNCIGLFGTCGRSLWRDTFVQRFSQAGIEFFNPLVDDWKPEDAIIEAEHLANDQIVCFPITGETYGAGSLAESGFSILNAVKLDERRDFILMIDMVLDKDLMENVELAKESLRARALVMQHLKKLNLPNVYLVNTLPEMFDIAMTLYEANLVRSKVEKFQLRARG